MANIILGASNVLEYIVETTFGTFPTNPVMLWPGLIQDGTFVIDELPEDVRGLKDSVATNKLQIVDAVSNGQELTLDLEYQPQNWTLFKYAMNVTGGNTLTDDLGSLSLGIISKDATPKYAKFSGFKIDSAWAEFSERKIATCKMKLKGANVYITTNNPWSVTDYKGTGSHATMLTTAPIAWKDITVITLGGVNIPNSQVGSIKFGIENNLESVLDAYATTSTRIGAIEPDTRNLKCSMTFKKKAIDNIVDKVLGFSAASLVITVGGTTFTFANAKIPKEQIKSAPKGMVSVDYDFVGINSLVIS